MGIYFSLNVLTEIDCLLRLRGAAIYLIQNAEV